MAITQILTTDTLEQLRVKINTLAQNDFGDPALLGPAGIAATSVVGAVIELSSAVFSAAGFGIEDVTSTFQQILPGERLKVLGTSNQINAVVSVPDTLTVSLTNNVNINNNLTVGNNLTATGSTHTLGTVEINGNTIRSTDSTRLFVDDVLRCTAVATGTGLGAMSEIGGIPTLESRLDAKTFIFDCVPVLTGPSIFFEGSTADAFETELRVANPTADRIVTIPNITGTLITDADTGTVSNTMLTGSITGGKLLDGAIVEAKIADGAVAAAKLKSVVTLQILNSTGGVLKTLYGAGA